MAHDVAELAYELSLRTLGQQEASLNELRARTGTILTASAIVASFLGATAVASHGDGWLRAIGLAAFVVSVGAAALVLWPKKNLVFAIHGSALLDDDDEGIAGSQRRLARWIDESVEANQPGLDALARGYRIATTAVLLQAALWLLKLGVS